MRRNGYSTARASGKGNRLKNAGKSAAVEIAVKIDSCRFAGISSALCFGCCIEGLGPSFLTPRTTGKRENNAVINRNLQTLRCFAASGPFSENTLRWYVFNAGSNGMAAAGALVRCGRRVFIDPEGFDRWLIAQNPVLQGHEQAARV